MEEKCKSCKYFRIHYVKLGKRYREVECGYCAYTGIKGKEALEACCEQYKQRVEDKE